MVRDTPTPGEEPRVARVTRSYLTRDQPGVSTREQEPEKAARFNAFKGLLCAHKHTFIGCYV